MKEKSNKWLWVIILIAVMLGIAILIFFILPFGYTATEEYTIQSPYMDTEYYTVQEPYQTTEYYYVDVPFTTQDCDDVGMLYKINYVGISDECIKTECTQRGFFGGCNSERCVRKKQYCGIEIINKEKQAMSLVIDLFNYNSDTQQSVTIRSINAYVSALDNGNWYWNFEYPADESHNCWYKVKNSPSMQECQNVVRTKQERREKEVVKYREVQKSRKVEKFKTVSQTRKVTKYATLFNQWTGNAQWYYRV